MKALLIGILVFASQAFAVNELNWGQSKVEAAALWSQGIKGAGIKIGLVDGHVYHYHQQLRANIDVNELEAQGRPGFDDDRNGYVDDILGWDFVPTGKFGHHATHVAGTLVASHDTGHVQGMAPQAQIILATFIDENRGGSLPNAIAAIQYSVRRGAKIINMGWGGAPYVQALRDVIVQNPNVLFVTSAGNDGRDLDVFPDYPASYRLPNLIVVGAITSSGFYTPWSNFGAQTVDLAAPGSYILSTGADGGTIAMDGTNIAVPFVSGAAALLWSFHPQATVSQIKQSLLAGVDYGAYPVRTQGSLNISKALAQLKMIVQE